MIVPYQRLSPETLRRMLEEFVTRDGTDYGAREVPVETRVAQVRRCLEEGRAVILFDTEDGGFNIVFKDDLPAPGEAQ